MAKPKFDVKDFLLRRGEVLAMGIAGLCLVVLLGWGATKWTSAMDPAKESQQLTQKVNSIKTNIDKTDADLSEVPKMPDWLVKVQPPVRAKSSEFTTSGYLFDVTAAPNTKRENPSILGIGEYQVDLVRGAMLGYDIILDEKGEPQIAVLTTKTESKIDDEKMRKAIDALKKKVNDGKNNRTNLPQQPRNPNQPMGPGGAPPGPGGPPPMGGGGGPPPMPGAGGSPHGLAGGGEYNQDGQRNEKAITYIPLKELDTAISKNKNLPAVTVIPLRLVTVHAVVPYKKQLEEIKRALRLENPPPTAKKEDIERADAAARQWGPWYDGFEVQRRVTRVAPDGRVQVIQDWPEKPKDPKDTSGNYKFEEEYIERIDTKKIADHFDEGYIPYFLKPEMMLAMPMPRLAPELKVKYPDIKLKDIVDNIEKLKRSNQKEMTPSDLLKQISGSKPGKSIYQNKTGENLGGLGYDPSKFGPTAPAPGGPGPGGSPPMPGPGPMGGPPPMPGAGAGAGNLGTPKPPEGYGSSASGTPMDLDNYLLRFVDSDVKPGHTYEYRIRLRMWNPNHNQDKLVANPEYAKASYQTLKSKWTETAAITVPAESYLFANDVKAYRDQVNKDYPANSSEPDAKALNNLLQVKDHQAVVQVATWTEQVRTDNNAKREPVGAWVVAEMPVGRGEFIGRKQYIKLPLWSSEIEKYVLRELAGTPVKGAKAQPKGWMVDFSTKSVLVDFEGGKVKARSNFRFDTDGKVVAGTRTFDEDVGTELLMVRPDGKLVVRNSLTDDADTYRAGIVKEWARWVDEVSKNKAPSDTDPMTPGKFDPKKN